MASSFKNTNSSWHHPKNGSKEKIVLEQIATAVTTNITTTTTTTTKAES